MKKTLFTLVVLLVCSLLTAQFVVWRNGQIMYQSDINEVDSVTLYELKSSGGNSEIPKVAEVEGAYVIVVQFQQKPCNDVILAGSYKLADGSQSVWGAEPTAKFEAIEGYDGWYKVVVYPLDAAENAGYDADGNKADFLLRGKPVQLTADGSFNWSYQWARNSVEVLDGDFILGDENGGEKFIGFTGSEESKVAYVTSTGWAADPCVDVLPAGYATFIVNIAEGSFVAENATFSIAGNFAEDAWNNSRIMTEVEKGKKYTWTGYYPDNFEFKVIQTVAGVDIWAEGSNAKFDGKTLEYTFSFVSPEAWNDIAKVEFYDVVVYGFYTGRQYPLSMMRGDIDENGDTIFTETDDINGDGEGDYVREVAMYIVADGVYMDRYGLTGEENYVIFIHSACPFDGTYVYPFGFYQFSADQNTFLIEHDGNQYMRWTQDVAYATYTNFNAESYTKYYHDYLFSGREWPATQEEYDAFMEKYGYWFGDYDSYVGYLRTPEGSDAYVQEPAGLVTGGIGFAYDWDENQIPYMPFLDVDLEFFTNLGAYGFAIEQAKDEEGNLIWYDVATGEATTENTGEPWLTYSTEGEGDDETFVMAPTIKRHFRIGKLASEEQQAPRRVAAPTKRISEKRIMANTLLNIPMKNLLLKR